MSAPTDPLAPSLVWTYPAPMRALLIRTAYLDARPWTDSAGVRACDVIGLDAPPAEAKRALIEYREGRAHRKEWVSLDMVASTPKKAAEKLAAHLGALFAAPHVEKPAPAPAPGWDAYAKPV